MRIALSDHALGSRAQFGRSSSHFCQVTSGSSPGRKRLETPRNRPDGEVAGRPRSGKSPHEHKAIHRAGYGARLSQRDDVGRLAARRIRIEFDLDIVQGDFAKEYGNRKVQTIIRCADGRVSDV